MIKIVVKRLSLSKCVLRVSFCICVVPSIFLLIGCSLIDGEDGGRCAKVSRGSALSGAQTGCLSFLTTFRLIEREQ